MQQWQAEVEEIEAKPKGEAVSPDPEEAAATAETREEVDLTNPRVSQGAKDTHPSLPRPVVNATTFMGTRLGTA